MKGATDGDIPANLHTPEFLVEGHKCPALFRFQQIDDPFGRVQQQIELAQRRGYRVIRHAASARRLDGTENIRHRHTAATEPPNPATQIALCPPTKRLPR